MSGASGGLAMRRRDLLAGMALAAAGAAACRASAAAADQPVPARGNVNDLVVRYIACWNERDGERRRDLVAKTWTVDGTYIDAHSRGVGHDGIAAMIAAAQARSPGYALRLASGIEAHNGHLRFRWVAGGSAEAPLYLAGTDFAAVADDFRLASVVGFVDAAPAPAAG
jgi:hypothetical protein